MTQTSGVVLVVDDNEANRTIYEKVIGQVRGADPRCFTAADDALVWLSNERPILAVVDYRMPGADGFDFIQRMRLKPGCNSVPVVMLTGVDDEAVRVRALALGVYDFMRKPVNKRRLQEIITFALRARLIEQNGAPVASPS